MDYERLKKFYNTYFSSRIDDPKEIKDFLFNRLSDPRFLNPYLDCTIQLWTRSEVNENIFLMHSKNNIIHNKIYSSGLHFLMQFADDPAVFGEQFLSKSNLQDSA